MKLIDRTQLIDQLNWRYATKQYDPARKISAADWATLEEALVLSPSSLGLQPWAFLVVDDPAVRARLMLASYGQPQVVTLGYRAAGDKYATTPKVRFAREQVVEHV